MKIRVTLTPHPTASPIAISQWLDWGAQIENGPISAKDPAPVQVAPPAMQGNSPQADKLFNQLVETKAPEPAPAPAAQPAGFAPIHDGDVGQPTAPAAEAVPAKRQGRPPSAATLAKRAAEAAAANTTAALQQQHQTNGAAPPDMGQPAAQPAYALPPQPTQPPVAVQQPAMPHVPPQPTQAFPAQSPMPKSIKDVDAVYNQLSEIDFRGARLLLRSPTWADGTQKPEWFTPESIAPECWDRVYGELAALLPVNVQPALGQ